MYVLADGPVGLVGPVVFVVVAGDVSPLGVVSARATAVGDPTNTSVATTMSDVR